MVVAGRCVAAAHSAVRDAAVPGVSTADLDAIAASVIRDHGCRPSFLGYHGYPASICASPNSAVVHGIPGDTDFGTATSCRSTPGPSTRGGTVTPHSPWPSARPPEVATLLEVTEQALWNGIAKAVAGNRLGDIGHAVEETARPHGYGVVREYVGHGIGRAMHEAPDVHNFGHRGEGIGSRPAWPWPSSRCSTWAPRRR